MGDVILRDPSGRAYTVAEEQAPGYLAQGFTAEGAGERADRLVQEDTHERYGGAGGALAEAGLSAVGTVTGGLSDAGLAALGGSEALRKLREEHPIAGVVGGVAGAFAPAGIASVAGKAGTAIRAGEEAGALAKLGRGALAGATEGAIYGAGQGVSELAMDRDPLTMERAGSVLSSNVLFGGALGGATGLVGGALEGVLGRSKRAIDRKLAGAEAGTAAQDLIDAEPDLAELDKRGLEQVRKSELEAIDNATQPARDQFVEDLNTARKETTLAEPWKVVTRSPNRFIREAGAAAQNADTKLRNILDNLEGLGQKPERALDALQRQHQAYTHLLEAAENEQGAYQREFAAAPDQIRRDILDRDADTWTTGLMQPNKVAKTEVGPFTSEGIELAVDREMQRRYGPDISNPALPERFKLIPEVQATLARNEALRTKLGELTAAPTSDRLEKIDAALDALGGPKPKPLGKRLLGLVPGGNTVLELADIGKDAVGSLRSATGKVARKTAETASALIGGVQKGIEKSTPVATKVLSEVSFGPTSAHRTPAPAGTSDLGALFRARTDEIKSQTAYDATGTPRVRPEARQAIAARLAPIAWHDPVIADRLESLAVRRMEYLSSIIPRRPDLGGMSTGGPDKWKPSDMEMRAWARAVAAVEDPGGVERRILAGTITPEDVTAYWAVYPERGRHFQQAVLTELPQRAKPLPYAQRIALGMFVGQPLDPSLHPQVLGYLQSQFTDEPGTSGGTEAPKAMPQFGSIKKSVDAPTPAQARSQGVQHL